MEALLGAWRLVSFDITYSDGRPALQPFGARPEGALMYTADGHVSALLAAGDRPALGAGRLERGAHASTAAKAAAFDTSLAYVGRWAVEGDEVIHTVLLSQNPDAVGAALRRRFELKGGALRLTYELTARSGVVRHYRLLWRRPTQDVSHV